jgi:hypothetical protein
VIWNLRICRPVPPTPQEIAQAERFAAAGGEPPTTGGPLVDPGDYTVEISAGANKSSRKFTVEEDPRITWFPAADHAKRRAAINALVEMTKQADALRKKFTAADTSLTALQASWKKPDSAKVPDDVKKQAEALKKSLDDLRPLFASRNRAAVARGAQSGAGPTRAGFRAAGPAPAHFTVAARVGNVRRRAGREPVEADRIGEDGDRRCWF